MLRPILAVLAGYATMVVLVVVATFIAARRMLGATDPRSVARLTPTRAYLAVNLSYSFLFAIAGGFVTSALAPNSHRPAIGGLLAVVSLMSIVSMVQGKESPQPKWYGPVLLVLGLAGVVVGGYFQSQP